MRVIELENIEQLKKFMTNTKLLPTRIVRAMLRHKDRRHHVFYSIEFNTPKEAIIFFTDEPTDHSGFGLSFLTEIENFISSLLKLNKNIRQVNYHCDFDFYWFLRNLLYSKYVESKERIEYKPAGGG